MKLSPGTQEMIKGASIRKKGPVKPEAVPDPPREEEKKSVTVFAGENQDEHDFNEVLSGLQEQMQIAARNLQFEKAAYYRDQMTKIRAYGKKDIRHI